ncbi:hypothetical protein [Variovorax sp. dw_954]|uniref:hypothetical protein n=1 Tax=Variovorax sp. dw_954 TaxID=2720078 RepID=UPI001BD54028|nr:hypothetical protein [Variovorax sp. dw_954]
MTKPFLLLSSLLLTGAAVALVGWQALFGITVLSFCTLLWSSEGPPQTLSSEGVDEVEAPGLQALPSIDATGIEEAIDDAGWYYPLADTVLALSAANETSFGDLEPGPAQVAFNAVSA